jgi:hypothetical protein
MTNLKLIPTDDKIISENYPYGYKLRTTKTDYLEFNNKKGFRHCSVTINPRNGQKNKPKKSTYHPIMLLGRDDKNYCQSLVLNINGIESIQTTIKFLAATENFDLFSNEQMHFIYMALMQETKKDMLSRNLYLQMDIKKLGEFYIDGVAILGRGLSHNGFMNVFNQIQFDIDAINQLKDDNFSPFVVSQNQIN